MHVDLLDLKPRQSWSLKDVAALEIAAENSRNFKITWTVDEGEAFRCGNREIEGRFARVMSFSVVNVRERMSAMDVG